MKCPDCGGPLGCGVFQCERCATLADANLIWSLLPFSHIPPPLSWHRDARSRKLVATYHLGAYQDYRLEFLQVQEDCRIAPKEQRAYVTFKRQPKPIEDQYESRYFNQGIPF